MGKYNLLFAIRNFRKQKLFSLVNLFGLTLGIVASCLIMIYVQGELSYDRFNKHADQIFRVYLSQNFDGKESDWTQTPAPLAAFLQGKFPAISNTVRISKVAKALMSYGENSFFEENLILADPSIFDVFTLPLISGNSNSVLNEPNSVVLTQSAAKKYFGNANPIGKTIRYNRNTSLTVSGIMKDIPQNSHLRFDLVVSMSTAKNIYGNDFLVNPMNTVVFTYLLIHPGVNKEQFNQVFGKSAIEFYSGMDLGNSLHIQPLTSIHLHSDKGGEFKSNGDIRTVYVLSIIALLILFIACINYINLSFSANARRATELGVRKVLGAGTAQLIWLYLSEVIMLTGISILAAAVIIKLLLPWFSALTGTELSEGMPGNNFLTILGLLFLFIVLITGPLSGWMVSRQKAVLLFRKSETKGKTRIGMQGLLVLFQFGVSIILIMTTLLVYRQMNYVSNSNLGFSKEQLMIIPLNDQVIKGKIQLFKKELLSNPNIVSASATSDLPGELKWVTSINYEGQMPEGKIPMTYLEVDKDFIATYGIQLKKGYKPGDTACPYNGTQYLLNETAAKKLGWNQPLGKSFSTYNGKQGSVTGIINDFHFKSLHENMEPLVIYMFETRYNFLTLKLATHDVKNTVSFVQQQWKKIVPDSPCEYFFYDSYYDQLYKKEARFGRIMLIFSMVAILIACLGIFGLAAFTAENRTKEIGIRKINGAKISEVMLLLNKDFVKWVVIAFLISIPISYYAMHKWLENFAYKTELSWWIFALSGIIAMAIALFTVSIQSWRAATRNPVESLKYE